MGQELSLPDKNVKSLQVIGCGLSRTGTTSFGAALSYLLKGPVYHGGTQLLLGDEAHMRRWIDILNHTPITTPEDTAFVEANLAKQLDGFVACTDAPPNMFTSELLRLYPNAHVICTTRDKYKWAPSIAAVGGMALWPWLGLVLYPLPALRWWTTFTSGIMARNDEIHGKDRPQGPDGYDDHMAYLKRVVPADRLHFFSVTEGWEPLCKILDVPVPDIPFPRANDAQASEEYFRSIVRKGIFAWSGILGGAAVVLGVGLKIYRQQR